MKTLVVYQERYEEYKWAIVLENLEGNKIKILANKNDFNNSKNIFKHSLCQYNGGEILQSTDSNYKLNKDNRLDTYSI